MALITCNKCTGLISYTKQATCTTFAMHSIVSKVNNNALLLQTMSHYKWGHAVMDDIIYRTKKRVLIYNCVLGQYFGKLVV